MNINIAKNSGFCFGVKNAIDKINILLDCNDKVYCIGDIIHNDFVNNKLKNKGLVILEDYDQIAKLKCENVVIRSHGIQKSIYEILEKNNNKILDLTCPYVKKIHKIVDEETKNNAPLIILGDQKHPEVIAIKSYAHNKVYILDNVENIDEIKEDKNTPIVLVSQTTQDKDKYKNIVDILTKIFYNIKVYNTICKSTIDRQEEAYNLSKENDIIFVIGSKKSSNTKKLYNICSKNTESHLIEDKIDFDKNYINNKKNIGIIAGASTPDDLIEEIVSYVRSNI